MRSLAPVAAVGTSAAIIGAVVLFLWVLGSSVVQREQFSTLELAPRDVDFYLALNTEPASSQWIAFANLLGTINGSRTFASLYSAIPWPLSPSVTTRLPVKWRFKTARFPSSGW